MYTVSQKVKASKNIKLGMSKFRKGFLTHSIPFLFIYPLKISENLLFFYVFFWYRKSFLMFSEGKEQDQLHKNRLNVVLILFYCKCTLFCNFARCSQVTNLLLQFSLDQVSTFQKVV